MADKKEIDFNENKATDSKSGIVFFNNDGVLNRKLLTKILMTNFILSYFIISNIILASVFYYKYNFNALSNFWSFEGKFVKYFYLNIASFVTTFTVDIGFFIMFLASIAFTILTHYMLYKNIKYKAKIQQNLKSLGLNQYYLFKKISHNAFIFKLKNGETIDLTTWETKKEEIKRLFGFNHFQFIPIETEKIKLQFSDKTPKIEDVVDYNNKDYVKHKQIFLGVGLEDIKLKEEIEVSKIKTILNNILKKGQKNEKNK